MPRTQQREGALLLAALGNLGGRAHVDPRYPYRGHYYQDIALTHIFTLLIVELIATLTFHIVDIGVNRYRKLFCL